MAMKRTLTGLLVASACCAGFVTACGDDDDSNPVTQGAGGRSGTGGGAGTGGAMGAGGGGAMDPQVPPSDPTAVQAWLQQGFYKSWECEAQASKKTDGDPAIHVHGTNRVCSNVLLASSRLNAGERLPVGVASVKELYNDEAGTSFKAAIVSVKTADNGNAQDWYWYAAPDKQGSGFPGCSDCHSAAGSDGAHPGLGNFVYFQVRGDEAQLPPTNVAAMKAWLAQDPKPYAGWSCEAAATPKTGGDPGIHVHGENRVCSNAKLAAGAQGPWPPGAAAVKEIFDANNQLMFYAVEIKTSTDSRGGAGWYWYEGLGDLVVAGGFGDAGPAKDICVGCHAAAGSDADHPGAGDYVYFRMPAQ
jgi:hypothetical protein